MILFKDITYKALQLAVTIGGIDLSRLDIYKEHQINIPELGLNIHAGIIGTSHFVQLKTDNGKIFTELFACDALDEKHPKTECFLPIDQIKEPVELHHSFFQYQFECRRESYEKTTSSITQWASHQQSKKPSIFLEFDFKTPQQDLPTSRTILCIQTIDQGVDIQTIHEYQEEDAIIISNSRIELATTNE